ncbi:hypothetical protein HDU85_001195 [Gaertneriomyces sp. JEL0708]|nr:hypothetical protein HDU85_001195 [Gaertneriomyces sp. JEL0708]
MADSSAQQSQSVSTPTLPALPTPEEIARKKAAVEAKFGPGSWEKSQRTATPHRCNPHLQLFLASLSEGRVSEATARGGRFIGCLWAKEGEEPPLF